MKLIQIGDNAWIKPDVITRVEKFNAEPPSPLYAALPWRVVVWHGSPTIIECKDEKSRDACALSIVLQINEALSGKGGAT